MTVLVAGSINVDLIQSVDALPRPGETILARSSVRLPGGKGANQAVAAARAGASTRMIAAVGDDEAGQWMKTQLSDSGVATDQIATISGVSTGTAYIAVDQSGENQIIVASGANAALTPEMTASAPSEDREVRVAQLEVPVETVAAFFNSATPGKTRNILNAAPAVPEGTSLFPLTDILIVNQHELAVYLGLDEAPANAQEALVARDLICREGQLIVVTLGASGAIAVRAQSEVYVPAFRVTPLDAIGAGDCFVGALAATLNREGDDITDQVLLTFANAAAALCTQKQGAIPAMPTRAEIETFLTSRI
jgi:ribokinase